MNSANRGKHSDAEEILKRGLNVYLDHAALHSRLGWLYRTWKHNGQPSPQIHLARDHFRQAGDLKSTEIFTYRNWWDMEMKEEEWGYAAGAAEKGIANHVQQLDELHHKAGKARSQLAWELRRQNQSGRANQEADKAETHFTQALKCVDEAGHNPAQFRAKVYMDRVAHYERLVPTYNDGRARSSRLEAMAEALESWQNELPDDPKVSAEWQRLLGKFPNLGDYLKA